MRTASEPAVPAAVRDCRSCGALPRVRVTHAESHRLPRTWRPIDEHPSLRPGPWAPRGDMKGIVFCESCGTLWYLFLDPGQYYYTDVIEMDPSLTCIVSEHASLDDVLPVALSGDALLQLMLRDWFALADYDPSAAAGALLHRIALPGQYTRVVIRLLDFLGAVLAGTDRRGVVCLDDVSSLADVLSREDLVSLDPARRASEMNEIRRRVRGVARAAFGSAFGADRDRLQTQSASRERLIEVTWSWSPEASPPVLAPRGIGPEQRLLEGVENLVDEIEDLLLDGPSQVTCEEIAPIIDLVRRFWDVDVDESSYAPRIDPGLELYRRCRDLLFALRHANLIPPQCEQEVSAVLSQP